MRGTAVAILVVAIGLATAARGAQSETGCPGSWTGSGEATYYQAFEEENACGLPLLPEDFVVAVSETAFDGSAACGRCLRVTGPLGSIVARVTDYCIGPACRDLDLSPNAFAAIGNPDDGRIDVSWESVACDVDGPISFYYVTGSGDFYAKIQVRNHRYGIAGLSVAAPGGSLVALPRTSDNAFTYSPGGAIAGPLRFEVEDLHGATLDEPSIAYAPETEVQGAGQFAYCPESSSGLGGVAALAALRRLRRVAGCR